MQYVVTDSKLGENFVSDSFKAALAGGKLTLELAGKQREINVAMWWVLPAAWVARCAWVFFGLMAGVATGTSKESCTAPKRTSRQRRSGSRWRRCAAHSPRDPGTRPGILG
jgi:hypothetical protein